MKKWSIALVLLFCGMYLFAQSLFDLVKTGTPEQVQAAIKAGANVNDRDMFGRTLLMYAAEYNENPAVITVLMNAGAKLDDRAEFSGRTPLMLAASFNKNPDVIRTLLNAGAKMDDRDEYGMTPLMLAAEYNENPDVITTLLNAGAKLDDRDELFGETPFMHAASGNENPDVITVLLNAGADAKAKSNEGKTAFDYAQDNPKIKGTKAYRDLNKALFR